jgi:serine/threonine protein kinase
MVGIAPNEKTSMPNPDGSHDHFDGTVISQAIQKEQDADISDRLIALAARDPMIGRSLDGGKYRITDTLGRGGMSVVYKAEQELVGRCVAIKTLTVQLLGDPTIVRRFTREVHALGRLNHPNIVTAFDCVVDGQGQPYFIMDYLDGVSLAEVFEAQPRLEQQRVCRIFSQVCSAVGYAHQQKVMHRDLKPGNIMLINVNEPDETVKIVDFGLAKISEDAHKLTASGEVWGTPSYMSPEQAHGQLNDHRSDIYSIGCVMYEALVGRPPFRGNSALDTLMMQINNPVASFAEAAPELNIHPALEYIVLRALAKDPALRFQQVSEMESALKQLNLNVQLSQPSLPDQHVKPLSWGSAPPSVDRAAAEQVASAGGSRSETGTPSHAVRNGDPNRSVPLKLVGCIAALAIAGALLYSCFSMARHSSQLRQDQTGSGLRTETHAEQAVKKEVASENRSGGATATEGRASENRAKAAASAPRNARGPSASGDGDGSANADSARAANSNAQPMPVTKRQANSAVKKSSPKHRFAGSASRKALPESAIGPKTDRQRYFDLIDSVGHE